MTIWLKLIFVKNMCVQQAFKNWTLNFKTTSRKIKISKLDKKILTQS